MELFREDGCLTDEGLCALREGKLDELGRLEAAEHLAYCDGCMDRYTALLTADVLETPPRSVRGTVMTAIWVKLMQNTYGRIAVAGVAAVLALSMWRSGALEQALDSRAAFRVMSSGASISQALDEMDARGDALPGKPGQELYQKLSGTLKNLLPGQKADGAATPTARS